MSEIIGSVYSNPELGTWEVWTNGRAYSDAPTHQVAYRWPDGSWRYSPTRVNAAISEDSVKMEELFSGYLNGVIVGPVDPLRHLRKK